MIRKSIFYIVVFISLLINHMVLPQQKPQISESSGYEFYPWWYEGKNGLSVMSDKKDNHIGLAGAIHLSFNQIDATQFPRIHCFVQVQDSMGSSIEGLDSTNFLTTEDGIKESIQVTTLNSSGSGVNVGMVLDRSNSMNTNGAIGPLKTAATIFINQMSDADSAMIVSFSSTVTVDQSFTNNKTDLINAIDNITASGSTHMLDAIVQAVAETKKQQRPRVLIVMTDGETRDDSVTQDSVFTLLRNYQIPVYTIGLGLSRYSLAENLLIAIADSSFGAYYYAPTPSDLMDIYLAISNVIQLQYQISYLTHNPLMDGTWRDVGITVNYNSKTDFASNRYQAPSTPDFQLLIFPDSQFVNTGDSVSFQVSMDTLNGFSEKIGLSVSGLPSSVTYQINPDSIDVLTTSTLDIQTNSSTSPGIYPFTVSGSHNALTREVEGALTVNLGDSVRIYPETDTLNHYAGDQFWLKICVGDSVNEVHNLFGVSFGVVFDSDWLSPIPNSTVAGPLLGPSNELRILNPQISGDTLFTAVTRIDTNHQGKSGADTVLYIKFKIKEETPNTTLCFNIIQPEARDPNWNSIYLIPDRECINVLGWSDVWPGDTDNNGKADQADFLPIGLSWFEKGFARDSTKYNLTSWHQHGIPAPQKCRPWPKDIRYTYADANGDGIVDDWDFLIIAVNFRCVQGCICDTTRMLKSHLAGSKGGKIVIEQFQESVDENLTTVGVFVEDVQNLFGIAVRLCFPSGSYKVETVERGEIFRDASLLLHQPLPEEKGHAMVVSRVRPESGVSGSGCIGRVRIKSLDRNLEDNISIGRVVGIDPQGKRLQFDLELKQSKENVKLPEDYQLYQNYPNPFNSSTRIKYELPERAHVSLKVYDLLGAEVVTLVNEEKDLGYYEVIWDGRNSIGNVVSSGIYCFSIRAGDFKTVKKGLLLK